MLIFNSRSCLVLSLTASHWLSGALKELEFLWALVPGFKMKMIENALVWTKL